MNKDVIVIALEIITIVTREIEIGCVKGEDRIPIHKFLTF